MLVILQKRWLLVGIVSCLASFNALAQSTVNSGVQFTGSVLDVKPWFVTCQKKTETCDFDIELLLQFRNGNSRPIIVFVPTRFYGDTKVSFLGSVSKTATATTSTTIKHPYFVLYDNFDPLPRLVQGLLTADSPFNDFIVIPPGGYHEWRELIRVPIGYKLKKEPDPKRKGLFILSAIPEFPAFKIEYFLSLRKRPEDSNALEKAKETWKELGDLVLDSSGDYRIGSEIILNKLP